MAIDAQGKELKVGQRVAYPVATSLLGIDTIKSIGYKTVTVQEVSIYGTGAIRRRHDQVVVLTDE